MQEATYQIRIDGTLPDEEVAELVGMRVLSSGRTGTVLEGVLRDQAELLGTVVRIEQLGCTVHDLFVVRPHPPLVGCG